MSFKADLKKAITYKAWKKIGIHHHHGINIPLFSIHTQKSCGIGEYLDLLPLIDWCSAIGMSVIQLLPLNESGQDPSPYNALSSCALHPIYLSLHALPDLGDMKKAIVKMQSFNTNKRLHYHLIYKEKLHFLFTYITKRKNELQKDVMYISFMQKHQWLLPYALFRTLKDEFNHIHWKHWPKNIRLLTASGLKKLYAEYATKIEIHTMIQYLCFQQLQKVKSYAESQSVLLKGDIPILVSPDSVDVWLHSSFFNFKYAAGSPPTTFDPKGQYWGFPLYNWSALEQDNFSWWKRRLTTAQELYHIYRIDHIIGFFRIWAIPPEQNPEKGMYLPKDPSIMYAQGKKILEHLVTFTDMLPIGEDLGHTPSFVHECLKNHGIPGTKIFRWERFWNEGGLFIPVKEYHPISMSSVSTHDLDTVKLWWKKKPEEASVYAHSRGWIYDKDLSDKYQLSILQENHHSGSLFHINLLQEYLALVPELTWENPEDERINYPGTISPLNWSYRYKFSLEKIISHPTLNEQMKKILNS